MWYPVFRKKRRDTDGTVRFMEAADLPALEWSL